jgi:hypothetical protein
MDWVEERDVRYTMKKLSMALCLAAVTLALGCDNHQTAKLAAQPSRDCCDVVERAILDAHKIRPGMTRRELELKWQLDGGIMPIGLDRYGYRECESLKLDVEFKLARADREEPEDTVNKISRPLYAEPPILE